MKEERRGQVFVRGWGWKVFCFSEIEPENSVIRTLPGRLGKIKMIIYLFTYFGIHSLLVYSRLQPLCAGIIDRYHLAWLPNIHRCPHHIDFFFFFFSKCEFSSLNCLDFKLTSTLLNFKEKQLHNFFLFRLITFLCFFSRCFSMLGLLHDRFLIEFWSGWYPEPSSHLAFDSCLHGPVFQRIPVSLLLCSSDIFVGHSE